MPKFAVFLLFLTIVFCKRNVKKRQIEEIFESPNSEDENDSLEGGNEWESDKDDEMDTFQWEEDQDEKDGYIDLLKEIEGTKVGTEENNRMRDKEHKLARVEAKIEREEKYEQAREKLEREREQIYKRRRQEEERELQEEYGLSNALYRHIVKREENFNDRRKVYENKSKTRKPENNEDESNSEEEEDEKSNSADTDEDYED